VIYFTGGHAVMWDFPDDAALQRITREIYERGGIVSSVCHGYCGLLNTKLSDGTLLVAGRRVTGFSWAEEVLARVSKKIPYNAEEEMKRRGALYQKARLPFATHVVVDCPYFFFSAAFRAAQYFFMRSPTAFRAAALIVRAFRLVVATTLARPREVDSSGNVFSIARISVRRRASVATAPALARFLSCSRFIPTDLTALADLARRLDIKPPQERLRFRLGGALSQQVDGKEEESATYS
jgi:putative intracellular protease/amidase